MRRASQRRSDTASLVIFDCDGVLVDSERLTVAVEARAAGMRCFGFGGGMTLKSQLEDAGAIVFDHMSNLTERLTGAR